MQCPWGTGQGYDSNGQGARSSLSSEITKFEGIATCDIVAPWENTFGLFTFCSWMNPFREEKRSLPDNKR
jgi:hypothetical protein